MVCLDVDAYPSLTIYPLVVEMVILKVQSALLPAGVYNCKYLGLHSYISTNTVQ